MQTDLNANAPAPTKNWVTAITFLVLLVLFLILNLSMAAPYFLAVLMGGILALLSFPIYKRLRSHGWTQAWASAAVTLAVTILIIGPLATFALIAGNEAVSIAQEISQEEGLTLKSISKNISEWELIGVFSADPLALEKQVRSAVQKGAQTASAQALAMAGGIPDRAVHLALALLSCFFLLIDGRRFLAWIQDKIPLDWDVRTRLYASFKDTAVSVLWATLAAASAQGVIMFFTFLILRVPAAFLAGGATFIFAWIPLLGSAPIWIAGTIYLYMQDRTGAMVAMLCLGAMTGIVDNYIRPWILKGRSDLHPLVSLIAIFGGISMFGMFGVLIGPILVAVLLSLLQIWPTVGKRFGLTFEEPTTGI